LIWLDSKTDSYSLDGRSESVSIVLLEIISWGLLFWGKMKKANLNIVIGSLAVGLAAILWSIDGALIRPKFYSYPPALVVFWEHFLGLILLSFFIFKFLPKIKNLQKKDWIAIGWISLLGGFLGTLFITKAFFAAINGSVSFSTVVILQKLQPIFAIFMARIILGEKMSKNFYLWAIIAIGSAYLVAFGKYGIEFLGFEFFYSAAFYALAAAFCFGSSTVFGKRVVTDIDFKAATALRFLFTSIIALAYVVFTGQILQTSTFEPINWLFFAIIVLTSGAGAMFIYYFGLKKIPASIATLFELFWPLSAITMDYFLNGNILTIWQAIGCIGLIASLHGAIKNNRI